MSFFMETHEVKSLPPQLRGRPIKFTPERIEQIKNLVERGHSRGKIAETVGCTLGTLAVTCSRLGISLRRPRFNIGVRSRLTSEPDNPPKPEQLPEPSAEPQEAEPQEAKPEPPPRPEPQPSVAKLHLSIRFEYRGVVRETEVPFSIETLSKLALEAEMRGMRFGEFIAHVLTKVVERDLFRQMEGGMVAMLDGT